VASFVLQIELWILASFILEIELCTVASFILEIELWIVASFILEIELIQSSISKKKPQSRSSISKIKEATIQELYL
jgi:type IV secretory pathway TrbD component